MFPAALETEHAIDHRSASSTNNASSRQSSSHSSRPAFCPDEPLCFDDTRPAFCPDEPLLFDDSLALEETAPQASPIQRLPMLSPATQFFDDACNGSGVRISSKQGPP